MTTYKEYHAKSLRDPAGFWAEKASLIDWQQPFSQVLDYSKPPFAKWFVGGTTNLCHNAVDRHLAERGDQAALIYVSTETGDEKTYTYRQLYREVNRMAGILKSLGVARGDRVLIYLPMIPEAAFAMLACARIGAIHSVVFGGFRIGQPGDAHRRCAADADHLGRCRIARGQTNSVQALARRSDWAGQASAAESAADRSQARRHEARSRTRRRLRDIARRAHERRSTVRMARVVRTELHPVHVGHDRQAERRAARYRRLCGRACCVDARHFLQPAGRDLFFDQRHRMGRRPFVHRLRAADQRHGHGHVRRPADPSRRRHLVEHRREVQSQRDVLVADRDSRTEETGPGAVEEIRSVESALAVSCRRAARRNDGALDRRWHRQAGYRQLLANRNRMADSRNFAQCRSAAVQVRIAGCSGGRILGQDFRRINRRRDHEAASKRRRSDRRSVAAGLHDDGMARRSTIRAHVLDERAESACVLDVRLGHSRRRRLLFHPWPYRRRDQRRGHRLGTREIEESLSSHPNVAEVAVVGVADSLKGQVALAFAILKDPTQADTQEKKLAHEGEMMKVVDSQLGAVARPSRVHFVGVLPKTRSGKLLRRSIQALAEGRDPGDLTTIEDPTALEQIKSAIHA